MDQYLDFARELNRLLSMKVTVIPIVDKALKQTPWSSRQLLQLEKTVWTENQSFNEDHPDHSTVKIS